MVPPEDIDENDIPDYVERIGLYADSAYASLVTNFGYLPAPVDPATGNDRYDIYLVSVPYYGATVLEQPADSPWNDYHSYIMINRSFYGFPENDDPEGSVIGAQKITSAHEYFHAVQYAYDYDIPNNLWWMESSSTYIEEKLFPEVNDNHAFLPFFFNVPETRLNSDNIDHMYSTFVWALYLDANHGPASILAAWQAIINNTPMAAIDSALYPLGESVKKVLPRFNLWNYFTGSRTKPGQYYAEAELYPETPYDQTFEALSHDSIMPITGPEGYACNYLLFQVDSTAEGIFEIVLEGRPTLRWALTAQFTIDENNR
jgi:hypothetical protein